MTLGISLDSCVWEKQPLLNKGRFYLPKVSSLTQIKKWSNCHLSTYYTLNYVVGPNTCVSVPYHCRPWVAPIQVSHHRRHVMGREGVALGFRHLCQGPIPAFPALLIFLSAWNRLFCPEKWKIPKWKIFLLTSCWLSGWHLPYSMQYTPHSWGCVL